MKNNILILQVFFILITVSCNKNNNPIRQSELSEGCKRLLIETNSSTYKWQPNESGYSIIINGTLKNKTDTVLYSKIADRFSGDTPCCFAGNSGAHLEKYDRMENEWREKNLASPLIEGAKIAPIQPSQDYFFYSGLFSDDQNESGTYRFRLDYYIEADPDSNAVTYFDYSNEFILE